MKGSPLIVVGIVLIILGAILRWDLVDWLIDVTGFLLIAAGVVIGIVGIVQLVSGKGGRSEF